ncbi:MULTISPECIES: glycosyltransferase family 2 protein [Paracoccaceae]|jgi:hypothetical protein|uniref:glycosyltransferase family 2 protein n=1 Tax=Rhodobacterales TaxID=204455 RepID=UPI001D0A234E|nr:glycosyltransferase family 2 protein [Boseongicola sp. H5]
MGDVSWGVVMTVREPPVLVQANVAWHLASGASEIHVYLDDPHDPAFYLLKSMPGCRVVRCTLDHWRTQAKRRARPASQVRRQSLNANHALSRTACDWLIHLDADEFLLQERPIAGEMAALNGTAMALQLPVWERIYLPGSAPETLFEGGFMPALTAPGDARSENRAVARRVFGADRGYRRLGLLGHAAGKVAVPVGQGFSLSIHTAFLDRGGERARARLRRSTSARILHFDGLTPLHWILKLLRYASYDPEILDRIVTRHRRSQIADAAACAGHAPGLRAFHDRLRYLTPRQMGDLQALGLLDCRAFDPTTGRSNLALDLTVGAFDAVLQERERTLLESSGLSQSLSEFGSRPRA